MIRNKPKLDKFHRKLIKEENLSYKKALSIYETLHKEAVALGIISNQPREYLGRLRSRPPNR